MLWKEPHRQVIQFHTATIKLFVPLLYLSTLLDSVPNVSQAKELESSQCLNYTKKIYLQTHRSYNIQKIKGPTALFTPSYIDLAHKYWKWAI